MFYRFQSKEAQKNVAKSWSSISAEEVPEVPANRFLSRISSKDE